MTSPIPDEPVSPDPLTPAEPEDAEAKKELSRRKLLKILAAGSAATVISTLPAEWTKPVVEVGVLPAHAAASATPPIPATQLTAKAISSTRIDLAWQDNSDVEQSYVVERSTDGAASSWSVLATLSADTVFYSDTTVSPGTTYYYRVQAKRSTVNVSYVYSNVAVATTP